MGQILVIDDEPLNLEIIMHGLSNHGYDIKCVGDAEQALILLHNDPDNFDVILLDRQLPGMNGLDFLKKIKTFDKIKEIPVIMQTAMTSKQDMDEGLQNGAYHYLKKPFDSATLLKAVESASHEIKYEKKRLEEIEKSISASDLIENCSLKIFKYSDIDRASTYISNLFPDPEKVSFGIHELVLNGLEHGNLDVGYYKKGDFASENEWLKEVENRQSMPENQDKFVHIEFSRNDEEITLTITDQGTGFDWTPYLTFNSENLTKSHGRGIAIANTRCFDTLEYIAPGNKVMVTTSID